MSSIGNNFRNDPFLPQVVHAENQHGEVEQEQQVEIQKEVETSIISTTLAEPTWLLLPPIVITNWNLDVWQDFANFLKVYNNKYHKQPADLNAEKALKEKYKDNYDVVCNSFELSLQRILPERISKAPLAIPPFNWREWGREDWQQYQEFLKVYKESASCSRLMYEFFRFTKYQDNSSFSQEHLTESMEEVEAIIASIKPSNKEISSKANNAAVATLNPSPASASAASAKKETDKKATYDRDPKNWNIADWHEFRRFYCEETVIFGPSNDDGLECAKRIKRKLFFQVIHSAISSREVQPANSEKEAYAFFKRREVIRDENSRYLHHHLFSNLFGKSLQHIPKISSKSHADCLTDNEVPFAICQRESNFEKSIIFKLHSGAIDTLEYQKTTSTKGVLFYYKPSMGSPHRVEQRPDLTSQTYPKSVGTIQNDRGTKCNIINLSKLKYSPDFVSDVEFYSRYVSAWKLRCFEMLNAALHAQVLLLDMKRIVNEYLYPETIAEAKAALTTPPSNLAEKVTFPVAHSASQNILAPPPNRPRPPCNLFGLFTRLFGS